MNVARKDHSLEEIQRRLEKLGFACPAPVKTDVVQAPMLALACMPMYYVAVVLEIQDDEEIPESVKNDIFGVHRLRELLATSDATSHLQLNAGDERQLRSMLINRRSVDAIIYEYGIETLQMYLEIADADVAKSLRNVVAGTMVQVAHASGKGWFGSGAQATPEQVEIIEQINRQLGLDESRYAEKVLSTVGEEVSQA